LNELSKGRRDVLPLAFHVTYWDNLGWKDPFSLQAATQRQNQYRHRSAGRTAATMTFGRTSIRMRPPPASRAALLVKAIQRREVFEIRICSWFQPTRDDELETLST